jgi:hypothetical protein
MNYSDRAQIDFDNMEPGIMVPYEGNWFYRDSYNQIWVIRRESHPALPITVSLFKNLNPEISSFEKMFREVR